MRFTIITAVMSAVIFAGALPAYSHGGKTHDEKMITALQAAQKAMVLYDRLIASGKLPQEWETGLKEIKIGTRKSADKNEYVIQFERTGAAPNRVYFFLNPKGEYSGSNFTGK